MQLVVLLLLCLSLPLLLLPLLVLLPLLLLLLAAGGRDGELVIEAEVIAIGNINNGNKRNNRRITNT